MTKVTPEDVKSIIDIFDDSDWAELHIKSDEFEIHLSKDPASRSRFRILGNLVPDAAPGETHAVPVAAPAKLLAAAVEPAPAAVPEGMLIVRAPNLGTFYKAPKPGAPPYVEIGQRVDPDTEICVIEVMKLFTPVRAGVRGIVRQALVNDSELVEFAQPLFVIEPSD